jgi:hypothetical protein
LCSAFIIPKLFHEKQLAAGWRAEAEENFHQKIILFASMEKFKSKTESNFKNIVSY